MCPALHRTQRSGSLVPLPRATSCMSAGLQGGLSYRQSSMRWHSTRGTTGHHRERKRKKSQSKGGLDFKAALKPHPVLHNPLSHDGKLTYQTLLPTQEPPANLAGGDSDCLYSARCIVYRTTYLCSPFEECQARSRRLSLHRSMRKK